MYKTNCHKEFLLKAIHSHLMVFFHLSCMVQDYKMQYVLHSPFYSNNDHQQAHNKMHFLHQFLQNALIMFDLIFLMILYSFQLLLGFTVQVCENLYMLHLDAVHNGYLLMLLWNLFLFHNICKYIEKGGDLIITNDISILSS